MVSLLKFTQITEEGVLFASPFDGKPTMLTVRASFASVQLLILLTMFCLQA